MLRVRNIKEFPATIRSPDGDAVVVGGYSEANIDDKFDGDMPVGVINLTPRAVVMPKPVVEEITAEPLQETSMDSVIVEDTKVVTDSQTAATSDVAADASVEPQPYTTKKKYR